MAALRCPRCGSDPRTPRWTTGAETKICPYCGETILAVARKCKHCNEYLDHELSQRRQHKTWNPGTAALLSLLIPGMGQMYKGQLGRGFAWLIGVVAGYCMVILPGVIAHICCIVDAKNGEVSA